LATPLPCLRPEDFELPHLGFQRGGFEAQQLTKTAGDEYWTGQYRLGNPQSLGVLYQRYSQKVYYRCLSLSSLPGPWRNIVVGCSLLVVRVLPLRCGFSRGRGGVAFLGFMRLVSRNGERPFGGAKKSFPRWRGKPMQW
jgi:hypothetical protein